MTRAVIVPFIKTQRRNDEDQFLAEAKRHELEDLSVHCLPLLISIGEELEKGKKDDSQVPGAGSQESFPSKWGGWQTPPYLRNPAVCDTAGKDINTEWNIQ